jgi:flagellar capping protein FliD
VDITVSRSTSAVSTALSAFADAYNAAVDEVNSQRGQGAGALGGQVVVSQLASLLSSVSTYSSDSDIGGLAALGLDLQTNGHLQYTQFNFMAADITNSTSVTAFLGSATVTPSATGGSTVTGSGFLKAATAALASVEDTTTGLLKTTEADVTSQITSVTNTIATKQSAVDALQLRLQNQMAASDALIAQMEQQYNYLSGLFQAQQTADQMYK